MAMNLAILSRTRSACEHFFARAKIFVDDLQSKYTLPIVGVFVAMVAVTAYAFPVQADKLLGPATDETNWSFFSPIILIIITILYNIVKLLLTFDATLTTMMIQFAQYNNFVLASPVTTGWPLVRDVCNMFFILVLLIVAFATIIGYEPFDYKKTVPKLLLMSVLINFSKTLVGLMIDFSQVVTLTFVNGFRSAAFGNMLNAFGMTHFLDSLDEAKPGGAQIAGNLDIMISLLFAVGMLSVLAMMLLIMSIYFLARVILLWVLLILSPLAFFAWALPDKLQKALDPLTGKWWKQLAALLTGGPIVAFFMWLTFAMVQDSGTAGVAAREQIYVDSPNAGYAGSIPPSPMATPDKMTTFMVATIMLLVGLKTAVDVSGEAAPQLGQLANKIKSTGGPVGWAAKLGYRGGKAVAKGGARAADRKWNISQNLGNRMLAGGAASGGMIGRAMGSVGAGLVGVSATAREEKKKKLEATMAGLSGEQKRQFLASKSGTSLTSNKYQSEEAQKLALQEAKKAGRTVGGSTVAALATGDPKSQITQGAIMQEGNWMMAGGERSKMVDALRAANPTMSKTQAEEQVRVEAADKIQKALDIMKENNDEDGVKKISDFLKRRPDLASTSGKTESSLSEAIANPDQLLHLIAPEALKSTDVLDALFKDGIANKDYAGIRDSMAYKKATSGSGDVSKIVGRYVDDLESGRATVGAHTLMNTTATGLEYGNGTASVVAVVPPSPPIPPPTFNTWRDIVGASGASAPVGITPDQADDLAKKIGREISTAEQRHLSDTSAGRSAAAMYAAGSGSGPGGFYTPADRAVMRTGQMSGLPSSVTVGYDAARADYATPAQSAADVENMVHALAHAKDSNANTQKHAVSFIGNMDAAAIAQGGAMTKNTITVLSQPGRMDQLAEMNTKTKGPMAKKVENITRTIYSSTDSVNTRAESGEKFAVGSREEAALNLRKAMESHPELGKVIGRIA